MALNPATVDGYLTRIKEKDKAAFEDLYIYSKELLYVYALSVTGDRISAEDAVQESFVKIWQNASGYHPGRNGLAWIITITKNTAIDEREKRKRIVVSDELTKKGRQKSHENAVVNSSYVEFIMKCLKPAERQVAMLHIYGDYTIKEIASLLSIPHTTAQWRYTSALKKLKAAIVREENEHERQSGT